MNKRHLTVSKFLSKYLRHEPKALGLNLAPGGWVFVADLLAGAAKIGFPITLDELDRVVAKNDKQRFSLDETGQRIRSNQGHSTEVDLQLKEVGSTQAALPRDRRPLHRCDPGGRPEEDESP
jgi:putative RNA 2'-phosphotransferase